MGCRSLSSVGGQGEAAPWAGGGLLFQWSWFNIEIWDLFFQHLNRSSLLRIGSSSGGGGGTFALENLRIKKIKACLWEIGTIKKLKSGWYRGAVFCLLKEKEGWRDKTRTTKEKEETFRKGGLFVEGTVNIWKRGQKCLQILNKTPRLLRTC